MRVSHFIGLHGIQVLIGTAMLLGFLAARRAWLRDERVRAAVVRWLAVGYLGVFTTAVVQAVRGQSFVAPDAASLAGYAGSVLLAAVGIALTIRKARKATPATASASELPEPAQSRR
jgi:ABC-type nickel/cobalt efflux system permease component RcnA